MSQTAHLLTNEQLLDVLSLTKTATAIHVGEDAVIQTANDAMLAIWGKDKTVLGKSLEDALPELKGQPFIDLFKKVWNEGLTISGTDTPADLVVNGKLQTFYFEFEYRAIKDEAGKSICILHTATDITERYLNRKALEKAKENVEALEREQALNEELASTNEELAATNEELTATNEELFQTQQRLNETNDELEERVAKRVADLSESEERFRTMAEGTAVLIAVGDESSNAIYFNQAWSDLTGKTMDRLTEFGWADLVHPEDRERYTSSYLSAFDKHAPFENEFRILNRHGDYRWLLARGLPRFRSDGSFAGYISSCIDITESKMNAQALEIINSEMIAANEQFRLAISTASLGTWRADLATRLLTLSERSKEIHGLTQEQYITLEQSMEIVLPEDRERLVSVITNAIKNSSKFEAEYRIFPMDGSNVKWLRSTGKVHTDAQGKSQLTGTIMDITQRKDNEIRKNDFIAMVSHELKTPLTSLTAIIQMTNVLLKNSKDTFLSEAMDKANNQAKKMANMINGFLTVSRLESGKMVTTKKDFNIGELIEEVLSEMKMTTAPHSVSLLQCDRVVVHADRDKIGSVISNLLSNAIKYSTNEIIIEVSCIQEGNFIKVSVKDSGVGIKAEDLPKLFERFYRVEDKSTQNISGFGIGLYLSAEIIQHHQGEIWAESEPGKGATFHFTLPLR